MNLEIDLMARYAARLMETNKGGLFPMFLDLFFCHDAASQ